MSQRVYVGGESFGRDRGYLLGRIKFWRQGGISRLPDGCILCVIGERELADLSVYLGCGMRIAGVIIQGSARRASLLALGVPCFLSSCELCASRLDGHIALIDFDSSRLLLDPEFEVLSEYAKREASARNEARARGGILQSASKLAAQGDLFEATLSLIEQSGAVPICISLELNGADCESVASDIEALFRAAVYGEISIMLAGFCSPSQTESANTLLHSVFCELESEGREVNGCVARGLLIDSPIWLTERHRLGRWDFLCFDFDMLTCRLLGIGGEDELDPSRTDSLCRFWEDYREAFCGTERAELRAICRDIRYRELFFDWVDFMNVKEIYGLN